MRNKSDSIVNINDNAFDIVRAICTFTVFLGHFITHFNINTNSVLFEVAYFIKGVPIFFFLSGLFIARSLEVYNTREFILKRIIRIYPELWVCVILNLIIILTNYSGTYTLKDILVYLATQLTFFQFYTGEWLRGYGVGVPNGALWTITVDIQFYILAILISRIMKKKPVKVWVSIIAFFSVLSITIKKVEAYIPDIIWKLLLCNIVPFLFIFLIGMFVYYHKDLIIPMMVKWKWIIGCAYLIWKLFVPNWVLNIFEGVRYNIATTLLLICVVISFGFSFKYRMKNDYSYSFYLYHMVIINFINHTIIKEFTSWGTFSIFLAGSFIIIYGFAFISKNLISNKVGRYIEKKIAFMG